MSEKKLDSAQKSKNKNILKLSLSSDDIDSDKINNEEDNSDGEDSKKKIFNKNKKILNAKNSKKIIIQILIHI